MSSLNQISRIGLWKRGKLSLNQYRVSTDFGNHHCSSGISTLFSRLGKEVEQRPLPYNTFTNQKRLRSNLGYSSKEHVRYNRRTCRIGEQTRFGTHSGEKGLNSFCSKIFFSTNDNSYPAKEEESWMEFMNLVEDNLSENKNTSKEFDGQKSQRRRLDDRAKVKLDMLQAAKLAAENAKNSYEINCKGDSGEEALLRQEWLDKEIVVMRAYSQAIKYVGRAKEAHTAERLLKEMIERIGAPLSTIQDENPQLKKKYMSKIIATTSPPSTVDGSEIAQKLPPTLLHGENFNVTRRDFHNVLHSWASSKARKKGEQAESLLMLMTELSWWNPTIFKTKPDSQTFALVIKCFAGSTHKQSLEKILNLHSIHQDFSKRQIPGFVQDDPFFLMHSLKALKNYNRAEESKLAKIWLTRLHSFVMNPENQSYYNTETIIKSEHSEPDMTKAPSPTQINKKIDLTGTYTTIIRSYAKLRGQKGAAENARAVLDMMHDIADQSRESSYMNDTAAEIQIKSNAYDLVLSSYSDSKDPELASKALDLFTKMFLSWSQRNDLNLKKKNHVPYPTEHSFEYCFKSMRYLNEYDIKRESMQLLDKLESMYDSDNLHFDITTRALNACIELYTIGLSKDPTLLPTIDLVLERVREISSRHPSLKPNVQTYSLILKACSLGGSDTSVRENAWERAKRTFQLLENAENASSGPDSKANKWKMTDTCYFFMMKNVIISVPDENKRDEFISQLFSQTCEKGLVSANILRLFKSLVSDEVYKKKVGSGRLADKWVANVTSSKVIYSDLTKGGEDKNARRKGKSTSGWLKKRRKRNR